MVSLMPEPQAAMVVRNIEMLKLCSGSTQATQAIQAIQAIQALLKTYSGSDQVRSPSAQVKAVAAHVRTLKRNR